MSRLLDALKNLQHAGDSSQEVPPQKVTPRLSASMRKAVGQAAPATITPRPAPDLLFRVPAAAPANGPLVAEVTDAAPTASAPTASAPVVPPPLAPAPVVTSPIVTAPVAPTPAVPTPDPVKLIEVIQASISSIQQEPAPQPNSAAPTLSPTAPPEPPKLTRPAPTSAEAELRGLLASEAHAQPYRDMLTMVQRNLAGKATPVVAIVGLDGQDSTEHVTAALGTLVAEQATQAVLLIEANPNRSLAHRYGALQSAGLTELLAGRIERSTAILPTSHERLDLLAFGLATKEQSQLLPPALAAALQHARSTHAAAVIDAGPLSSPWALPASQAADAVYLVVRVGDTSAEYATGCVERFRAAGGKLTGCIAVGPLPA